MNYQNVSVTRISKKFTFCFSVRNFRQRLREAESQIAKAIPVATVRLAGKADKSGIDLNVSFKTEAVFFCNAIFRLVSSNGEEIISSPKTNLKDAAAGSHAFDVSKKSPNCVCVAVADGYDTDGEIIGYEQAAIHKGRACYDYIPDFESDVLKIQLDLEVAWDETATEKDTLPPSVAYVTGPTAFDDITKLLKDEKSADVVVTCEGETFPAFKLLLCARSEVFKAMLTGDTKEAKTNKIDIKEGVRHEMMSILLQFLATDEVDPEDLKEHAMELLAVADIYHVKRLRSMCEVTIQNGVDAQNCAECLVLAERYRSLGIKTKAISVIKERKKEVQATIGWKKLVHEHPDVVSEILFNIL